MLWKIAKASANETVEFAAEELKRCLRQMDPALETAILAFPEYDPALTDVLWLGVCPKIAERVPDPLRDDSIRIQVKDGRGAILGSNPRSVLMGVYRFLRELGCAWIRPGEDGEILPPRELEQVDVTVDETPSYRHRSVCIEGAVSGNHVRDMIDWLPKVGMNGYFNQFHNPVTFYERWYGHQKSNLPPTPMSSAEICGLRNESVRWMKKRGMSYHVAGHGWTCEPFGIPGESWDHNRTYDIAPEQRAIFAEVGGVRDLWHGIPLNTNLCYSKPQVRKTVAEAIADFCKKLPETDFLHLWLADSYNNHCECPECVKKQPSDWYVMLLNEVDEALTREHLPQKVVFLVYLDLLWAPKEAAFKNPDRFTLMFAPIFRTYSKSFADRGEFSEENLPEYRRNHLTMPKSVEENLAYLRCWQKLFKGDSFVFDYHFMWDHFKDLGHVEHAKVLFRDMQALHGVGLEGMVSCQNQRVWLPTGLGMWSMAAALWDESADFDTVAADYFRKAFGEEGYAVQSYLTSLSDALCPPYARGETEQINPEAAEKLSAVPGIVKAFRGKVVAQTKNDALFPVQKKSWEYLLFHGELVTRLAAALQNRAEGGEDYKARMEDTFRWVRAHEREAENVFDGYEFQSTYQWMTEEKS